MKLAIVHDWIVDVGGAERVLAALHRLWPDAPIYTLVHRPATVHALLPDATVVASKLQRIPGAWRIYSWLAPLMPSAMESFDLSGYDTVLSSSVLFSKGIVVRPGTRHICYCYSPSRMLWDRAHAYERRGFISRIYRHFLRLWDFSAAQRPDTMVAISETAASRIRSYYRRDSIVVPPPTQQFPVGGFQFTDNRQPETDNFFLIVSRLVPHKSLDMVLNAFAKLKYRLVIAGDGPLRKKLQRHATANVTFAGQVNDDELNALYEKCNALIVPNEEDWGLTAVEAMMRGKPVLALRKGGATETVLEGITGEFFDDPIPEALAEGIRRINSASARYNPDTIRAHAAQWGLSQFETRMRALVEKEIV